MNYASLHAESLSTLLLSPTHKAHYSEEIYSTSSALLEMFVAGKPCDRHVLHRLYVRHLVAQMQKVHGNGRMRMKQWKSHWCAKKT